MLLKTSVSGEAIQLRWTDPPEATQSFVVSVEEPMHLGGTVRWLRYDVPPSVVELRTDETELGLSGANDVDRDDGEHPGPYRFRLYALDEASLQLGEGATLEDVRQRMQGHVLDAVELTGTPGPATPAGDVRAAARHVFWGSLWLYGILAVGIVLVGIAGIFLAPMVAALGVLVLVLWSWANANERRKRRFLPDAERRQGD